MVGDSYPSKFVHSVLLEYLLYFVCVIAIGIDPADHSYIYLEIANL
jgi:hypothetical protein